VGGVARITLVGEEKGTETRSEVSDGLCEQEQANRRVWSLSDTGESGTPGFSGACLSGFSLYHDFRVRATVNQFALH
jgi:hypothetical protein